MDNFKETESKERTVSSTSSASSVTEYVNEGFEESEVEMSKVISIQVSDDVNFVSNPLAVNSMDRVHEPAKNLQNFSDAPSSEENSTEFIPRGFRKMYLASLIVLMFAACMGMTASYTATAIGDMKKPESSIHPNDDEATWIGSLMAAGALIGGTVGGYFANLFGRKGSLIFNTVPFVTGWLLITYAESTAMIYIGRLITGFSTGIVSVSTPMYLVEISTPEIRGLLGASFQLFVVIGVLLVNCLGSGMSWRYLAVSGAVMSLCSAFLMIFMPESPRWLMSKKRREEAKDAIIFLQGESYDSEGECRNIEIEIAKQPVGRIQFDEFKSPEIYKPFTLSILLMFFQQFSGVNAVLFYTGIIFTSANVPIDVVLATIIVAIVQVLATLLGSVLMDRAGRKPLLLTSAICMALSLIVFGIYDLVKSKNADIVVKLGWLPVICLTFFIAAFSIGYGPTPWLMVAEMTPGRFKSIITPVATALNWTFAFIITKTFSASVDILQPYGVYWLYSSVCLLSIVVTVLFLPETKGKKIHEIEAFFKKGKTQVINKAHGTT